MTTRDYYLWLFIVFVAVVCFTIGYIAGREKNRARDE